MSFRKKQSVKCHGLNQGGNKLSDRCSLLTPTLPPREGNRRKRERDLQTEYKNSFTNNTNNTININITRNNAKYTKLTRSFLELGTGVPASHQQLPGSTRQSQTGLSSRQELDSEMHGLDSGSGSQAGQGAGSSSEACHGRRERDPHDPPALN